MRVPYLKMQGTGNQILVVDQRTSNRAPPMPDKLRELGNEASGPGFDQLLWVGPTTDAACVASYRIFNADGSEVEQCGNGVRCVARFLATHDGSAQEFVLESPAGHIEARINPDGLVTVSMGNPKFDTEQVQLVVLGKNIDICVVSLGNPHCVLQVETVADAPVGDLGPAIEHHECFPQLINVGFMAIIDRQNIDLRVHERGVGETQACGTGACAAVVAGQRMALLDEHVNVQLPGGQVMVSWRGDHNPVWLTGNAELISEGMMDLED
ncbi:MAG: diaminopimelate epimerase [Proteobacteria bacterium]|nr:diaminopimelate epimerase [Pseudomonadota bacterium]